MKKKNYIYGMDKIQAEFNTILLQKKFTSDSSKLKLEQWQDTEKKHEIGLVINLSVDNKHSTSVFEQLIKTLKLTNTTQIDNDLFIGFDDSIALLKYLKANYRGEDKIKFTKHYQEIIDSYVREINNFSRTSKLKPSVIAEQILGETIELRNIETFSDMIRYLPHTLKAALNQERGLLHYHYAYGSTRFHLLKFSLDEVRNKLNQKEVLHFDEHYKNLEDGINGDALKAAILANIQQEIGSCGSEEAVKEKWLKIEKRYDYKLLGQSQGITTKLLGIFGVKTSSIEALDKWMNFTYPDVMQSLTSSNPQLK